MGVFRFLGRMIGPRVRRFYRWTGFGEKKLIDYIQLIVLPFVLVFGGQLISQAVNASARAQALEQAQEARLKDYLDRTARLVLDRGLLTGSLDAREAALIREVGRAQTLTAVDGMDGARKRFVITFLYELGLINGIDALIDLNTADLSHADLNGAELFGANLSGARLTHANLERARLTFAQVNQADLSNANLRNALMVDTRINNSDFRLADLSSANLSNVSAFNADLRRATLRNASLRGANLRAADLRGADLTGASLVDADLTDAIVGDDNSDRTVYTILADVDWTGATCVDGTKADANGGTCIGHLVNNRP